MPATKSRFGSDEVDYRAMGSEQSEEHECVYREGLRRLLCLSRFHVDNSIRACERVACIAGPALALRPFWKAQAVIAGDHKTPEHE